MNPVILARPVCRALNLIFATVRSPRLLHRDEGIEPQEPAISTWLTGSLVVHSQAGSQSSPLVQSESSYTYTTVGSKTMLIWNAVMSESPLWILTGMSNISPISTMPNGALSMLPRSTS